MAHPLSPLCQLASRPSDLRSTKTAPAGSSLPLFRATSANLTPRLAPPALAGTLGPTTSLSLSLTSRQHESRTSNPALAPHGPRVSSLDVACRLGTSPTESPLAAPERTQHWSSQGASSGAEAEEVLIELRDVYKSFGDKHILKGASLKIRNGEAVGIIGPSGTGKSTVLKLMAGLLAPDQGEVWIAGKKREGLMDDGEETGLKIGLVFQSGALFDSLTVRENVGFLLYEHSNLSNAVIEERVKDSLKAVGLKGVEDRLPSELSGGMRKRVALARAIISESSQPEDEREVVMYDEPTAGLDPIASTVVEDLIRSVHVRVEEGLNLGKIASYIVVTHQHSTIRRAVDRLLFLYDGKVQWEGKTEEFDTTQDPLVRQFAEGSLKGPIRYV